MNNFEGIHPAIIGRLKNTALLTDDEILEALSYFEKRCIKRKEYILRAGEVCREKI